MQQKGVEGRWLPNGALDSSYNSTPSPKSRPTSIGSLSEYWWADHPSHYLPLPFCPHDPRSSFRLHDSPDCVLCVGIDGFFARLPLYDHAEAALSQEPNCHVWVSPRTNLFVLSGHPSDPCLINPHWKQKRGSLSYWNGIQTWLYCTFSILALAKGFVRSSSTFCCLLIFHFQQLHFAPKKIQENIFNGKLFPQENWSKKVEKSL
jgi:hypothetical protein